MSLRHVTRVVVLTSSPVTSALLKELIEAEDIRVAVIASGGGQNEPLAFSADIHLADAFFIEAALSPVSRVKYAGFKLGQYLRREHRYRGYLIFLGFAPLDRLAGRFTIVGPNAPGSEYLRLPTDAGRMRQAARSSYLLSEAQLRDVVLAHCGLVEEARRVVHDLSNWISRWSTDMISAGRTAGESQSTARVRRLREVFSNFGLSEPERITGKIIDAVDGAASDPLGRRESLLRLLDELDATLSQGVSGAGTPESRVGSTAPRGYDTILIADDEGYPDESINFFESLGYSVTVVTTFEEAALTITSDPCAVLLCDQTFAGDPTAGAKLLRIARRSGGWRLLVAVSGSRLLREEASDADLICAHPRAKLEAGAQEIHGMICEWAEEHP